MTRHSHSEAWHAVVLDLDEIAGRRLAETVTGAGFRAQPVDTVGELQEVLGVHSAAVAVIAYEALFPLPQRALRRLRDSLPRACIVVVHADQSPRLRLGERLWALGLMDYFLPRSSPPHVLQPLLRQAYADTLIDDASIESAAHTPGTQPSPLRLISRLSTALMSQRSLPGLLRVLHSKLSAFVGYDLLEVLSITPQRRQLFIFPTHPVEHEVMWAQVESLCRSVAPLVDGGALAAGELEFVEGLPLSVDGANAPATDPADRIVLCFPLVACGETVGGVAVGLPGGVGALETERLTLQLVTQHLATALRCVYALEESEQTSLIDELTGIHNRRYLRRVLEDEWARSTRYDIELSIAVLDLDHFKAINDTYGHLAGDHVLREFAHQIGRDLRDSDTLARYGGEEFVIVLPQTGAANAARVVDRMRRRIEGAEFKLPGRSELLQLTFSAGVSCSPQIEVKSIDELVERADDALLSAKRSGRNQVHVATRHISLDVGEATEQVSLSGEQRRHHRVRLAESVACLPVLDLDPTTMELQAVDVSEGGVQLEGLPPSLSQDSYTLVYFAGSSQPRLAQVVWTAPAEVEGGGTRAGLRFVNEIDLSQPDQPEASRPLAAPRALVVVGHPLVRDIAQRVLRSTRYETTVLAPDAAIDLATLNDYSLIVIGDSALGKGAIGAVAAARGSVNPGLRIVLLNQTASRNDLLHTIQRERVEYLVAKDSNQEEALFTTISKLLLGSYFGIRKYLLWGASTKSWMVKDHIDKIRIFDELRVLAASVQCHPRITDLLITAVDEMMINALYLDVPAEQRKPITVEYGSDGRLLAVAVIDPYGAFEAEHLYHALGESLAQELQGMASNATSGNLGFRTMLAALSHLVVNVEPGKRTELIGIVDLRKSLREHRLSAPSFGVFSTNR